MLQSVRNNMKSTMSIVVIIIFIIPMVLTGVGSSFLGSVAGTNAATVDGREISQGELRREIYMQKQRMLSQRGADPSSDMLKDENLRGPVLDRLTSRAALLAFADRTGMGVSEEKINSEITSQQHFQIDGVFDSQRYKELLGGSGFTPASYKTAVGDDLVLSQLYTGLNSSGFVTDAELDAIIKVAQQARSFSSIEIPKSVITEKFEVTDEEIEEYYNTSQQEFLVPDKVVLSYVEVSVDEIAKTLEVSEADVKAQYDQEVEAFDEPPEVEISHILIEKKNDGASAEIITEVTTKLSEGVDFAELAKTYSDDAGSKEDGGSLGVLTPGVFPSEFESAAYALEEGQVSDPVVTDSGTHFIKVTKKSVSSIPEFEERKEAIEKELKQAEAEAIYIEKVEQMEELLDGAESLAAASDIGLEKKQTAFFEKNRPGAGITSNKAVRDAAFDPLVLIDGLNSGLIEISNTKSVIVRMSKHRKEHIDPLANVKARIKSTITRQKTQNALSAKANEVIALLKSGEDGKAYAEKEKLTFKQHENAKRTDMSLGYELINAVFAMPRSEDVIYEAKELRSGNYLIVKLDSVKDGTREAMPEQQLKSLIAQLNRETSNFEAVAYQDQIVESADITIN